MSTLAELASQRTALDEVAVDHLMRLVASWSLLSDLAFSDLLLMAELADGDADDLIVLGQMRPNNRATLLSDDLVGTTHRSEWWPLVRRAFAEGVRVEGQTQLAHENFVPVWCVPVRKGPRVVAVLVRLQGPLRGTASLYERSYLSIFQRLCDMVADSTFPFREEAVAGPGLPRVGDGVVLLDRLGRVEFATPNAVNALHRLGVYAPSEGHTLAELGVKARAVERSLAYGLPTLDEVESGHDVVILFHGVPLLDGGVATGVLTLLRDVSDLRQLNRIVLSRETAVREVHHRVKNNLQTISSLLHLQARRSDVAETKTALLEAERRVRSIAVVHEVLSREPGEEVVFDEIVRSLVLLVEDTVLALHPVEIVVNGTLGVLSSDVATPLAVALAELLTNAVEHAFVDFAGGANDQVGVVTLNLHHDEREAVAEIRDNGRGLDESFSLEYSTSLGLSIVRDLVRNQLRGSIEMRSSTRYDGGGAYVRVSVPLERDGEG